MPMVYTITPASPGNLTTNATAATETDAFFVKAGTRNVALQSVYVIGKGAGLTAISGIAFRVAKFATASTAGTAITPVPKDPGMQAAKCTSASRPTAGTTRSNQVVFGCGWVAPNPDSTIPLEGSAAGSIDMFDVSGTASLAYEFSAEVVE
jgi:hypothetical protein